MGEKMERKSRYYKKRSTSADKTGFQGIVVSVLTATFQKRYCYHLKLSYNEYTCKIQIKE